MSTENGDDARAGVAGWASARVSDLAQFVTSGSRGWGEYYADVGARFVRVGDFDRGTIALALDRMAHVRPPRGAEGERTAVLESDVLLTITADVGMVAVAPSALGPAYVNQHVALIRPMDCLEGRYLAYSLLDPTGFQRVVRAAQYGATKAGLSLLQIREFEVKVPPVAEQHRIVEALDTYLSRLDAAVANLERAQAKLKAYRASVLKSAVEGRLVPTEAELARQEKRTYEPAPVLLERILKERRRRWEEAELAKLKAAGKAPKDDKWKAKYQAPEPPDTSTLPELPEGWCWASVGQVAVEVFYGSSAKTSPDGEVPVLRMGNIFEGSIDLTELKYLPTDHHEFPALLLAAGDLLFNRTNSAELVGKSAIYRGAPSPCSFASYLISARMNPDVDSRWVAHAINSPYGRFWVSSVVSQQVGQANVNGSKLKAFPIPLPPAEEQARALDLVDALLSSADQAMATTNRERLRTSRLRQSILKWAFEGKLVDQDPNDEPAEKLLARIRAERAAKPTTKTRGRKAKATT